MGNKIIEILDAQLGKVLLLLALLWTGWSLYANWSKPVPAELTQLKLDGAKPEATNADFNLKFKCSSCGKELDAKQVGSIALLDKNIDFRLSAICPSCQQETSVPAALLPVVVEVDTRSKLQKEDEGYYVSGGPEPYTKPGIHTFVSELIVKNFTPVDLDIPQMSVKRPPMILPSPGPSLEGADKLPRFGDEFAPPTAADLVPAPKNPPIPK